MRHPNDREDDDRCLLTALGRLWAEGVEIDWSAFHGAEERRRVPLPTYPFERQRFWIRPSSRPATFDGKPADISQWSYTPGWASGLAINAPVAHDDGSWLLIADSRGLTSAMHRLLTAAGVRAEIVPANASGSNGAGAAIASLHARGFTPTHVVHCGWLVPESAPSIDRSIADVMDLASAIGALPSDHTVSCWFVGNGLLAVEEINVSPASAAVGALLTVASQEVESMTCRIIDVGPGAGSLESLARLVLGEVLSGSDDVEVALRGGRRLARQYVASPIPATRMTRFRRNGVYLITGGCGQVGRRIADYLTSTYDARVVLTTRSAARATSAVRPGVAVVPLDVTDAASWCRVFDDVEATFGAVNGVIHAAGLAGGRAVHLLSQTGPAEWDAHFGPKVRALDALAEACIDRDLDFVLLMSSMASVLGGMGLGAYATANRYMDAFAIRGRARSGRPWLSVSWDGWPADERDGIRGGTRDRFAMSADECVEALERVLSAAGYGHLVMSTGALEGRLAEWVRPLSRQEMRRERAAARPAQRPSASAEFVAPESERERSVAAIWQDALGVERVGLDDNFFELGGSSLNALKVMALLDRRLGVKLPIVTLFEHPTVRAFAAAIGGNQPAAPVPVRARRGRRAPAAVGG